MLYARPESWLTAGQAAAVKDTDFVLEVQLWTGGKIALDQVITPKNLEVTKAK